MKESIIVAVMLASYLAFMAVAYLWGEAHGIIRAYDEFGLRHCEELIRSEQMHEGTDEWFDEEVAE